MSGGGHFLASFLHFESLLKTIVSGQSARLGFTLAEVLVTLGIIGVVSAMTVPTLVQNYQKKSYVTQLHKFYNELSQALTQYQTDKNAVNLKEAGLINLSSLSNFVKSYFKIVSDCGQDEKACFATSYRKINGLELTVGTLLKEGNSFILASGQSVNVRYNSSQVYTPIAFILVDVNGVKGPNIQGRDLFEIIVYNTSNGWFIDDLNPDATSATVLSEDDRNTQYTTYCIAGGSGNTHGCFGKILNDNWEMNY